MNDVQREIQIDEEQFDISDFGGGDIIHDLLIEREQLLADGVKRKAERLKKIEDQLKDAIDHSGEIIDEDLGVKINYQHRQSGPVWDAGKLVPILGSLADQITYTVDNKSVQALIDSGKITEREIRDCASRKPVRGQLIETRLPSSLR